ncbi:hypothetical protein GCM10025768_23330 [Microbacterium pseudoresistens]|uniref:Uncharacterized protein n=1 Tax=Microbacterium pseudoresistens TaxID=640634 RepID=A0A7Y9ETH3_9MICO|nr:hypothetical protein [Microbacterium pseudoresistens]NYD53628.1 hypothetical protein [Microbacterium pseudoresistens]
MTIQGTTTTTAFFAARDAYREARRRERQRIVARMAASGYRVPARGGHGAITYTSGHELDPPHDLRNWSWIDGVRHDGVTVRVMLQSFDQDPASGNEHVLYDRISIGVRPRRIHHSRWLTITELELPLDDASLDRLIELLDALRPHSSQQRARPTFTPKTLGAVVDINDKDALYNVLDGDG